MWKKLWTFGGLAPRHESQVVDFRGLAPKLWTIEKRVEQRRRSGFEVRNQVVELEMSGCATTVLESRD